MIRILRNPVRQHINSFFRGRDVVFKSKSTKAFDMDNEEESAEYFYWKQTFGFLYDDSVNVLGGESNEQKKTI